MAATRGCCCPRVSAKRANSIPLWSRRNTLAVLSAHVCAQPSPLTCPCPWRAAAFPFTTCRWLRSSSRTLWCSTQGCGAPWARTQPGLGTSTTASSRQRMQRWRHRCVRRTGAGPRLLLCGAGRGASAADVLGNQRTGGFRRTRQAMVASCTASHMPVIRAVPLSG